MEDRSPMDFLSPMSLLRREPDDCDSCSDPFPMALAMAYVRCQQWGKTYDPDTALERGTFFPDLDKPFIGKGAVSYGRK